MNPVDYIVEIAGQSPEKFIEICTRFADNCDVMEAIMDTFGITRVPDAIVQKHSLDGKNSSYQRCVNVIRNYRDMPMQKESIDDALYDLIGDVLIAGIRQNNCDVNYPKTIDRLVEKFGVKIITMRMILHVFNWPENSPVKGTILKYAGPVRMSMARVRCGKE